MDTKFIALSTSLEETNLILEALGNLPFVRVYALIAKIQTQANEQIAPPQEVKQEP